MLGTLWASNKKEDFGYSHIGHAVTQVHTEKGYNGSKAFKVMFREVTYKKYKKKFEAD